MLKNQILMVYFCVTHDQNFNFCLVKLIWKSNSSYYSLSRLVTKAKMMKLIVTINSENVGQIISVGRIATYVKIHMAQIHITENF